MANKTYDREKAANTYVVYLEAALFLVHCPARNTGQYHYTYTLQTNPWISFEKKKKSIVFLISDFFVDQNYRDALKIANKKHDLVALRIIDTKETELPNVGLVKLKDNETGKLMWVDTSDKTFRKQFAVNHLKFEADLKENFNRSGIDATNIFTHENYVKPLMNLFKNR